MNLTRDELTRRPKSFAGYAFHIHQLNHKWWIDLVTGKPLERNKHQMCMLMLSELAEAMEGERKNLQDDKLPHRRMAEVELADTAIRLFDFAAGFGYEVLSCYELLGYHYTSDGDENHVFTKDTDRGEMLFGLSRVVSALGACFSGNVAVETYETISALCSGLMHGIETYCHVCGYDLWDAVDEKNTYNTTRRDHSREGRLEAGGKAW